MQTSMPAQVAALAGFCAGQLAPKVNPPVFAEAPPLPWFAPPELLLAPPELLALLAPPVALAPPLLALLAPPVALAPPVV